MMKFTKSGFLINENIIKLSKRTLINGLALGIARYEKNRQIWKLRKNNSHFLYNINNSPAHKLPHETKLWTFMVTNLDGELDLLKHGLTRVYENISDFQSEIVSERDIKDLHELGPMTMRMFHYLDLPEKALEFYSAFNSNSFFDSKTTLLVLMDLLFVHGKYQRVLDVYRAYIYERQREPSSIHRTMVIAACYKLNTPESFQIARDLRDNSNLKSEHETYQSKNFVAMLALNQKDPKLALSILSESENVTASMNIRLLAMAALNDWHGVADLLCLIETKHWQETNGKAYRVSRDVFQKLVDSISEKDLPVKEYDRCNEVLLDFQKSPDLLQKASMDELLCWPIDCRPKDRVTEVRDYKWVQSNEIVT